MCVCSTIGFDLKLVVLLIDCLEGDSYYKYDDDADKVVDGFPRSISADFGAKPGSTDGIPDNLDAAVFDNRDSMIYFFKGSWVSYSDQRYNGGLY